MNSGFLKTFALAIILTAVLIIAVNVIGDFAVRPKVGFFPHQITAEQNKTPTAPKAVVAKTVATTTDSPAPTDNLATLLASADPVQGKKTFRKCRGCHSVSADGPNLVGPNLWGVVGRARGSHPGYKYSAAMSSFGGKWTYDDLNAFLTSPKAFVKGTKMPFKGLHKPTSRAAVIAYLRTLSDNPEPLPQ